jgi:23S rRNA (cytidine2498-2'-O)-methyltransferase
VSVRTAYLAAEGFAEELDHELGGADTTHGRLLIASGPPRPAAWAANVWLDPQEIAIASISDAAAKLRALQRNWAVYAPRLYRRAMLIQEQLPKVSAKSIVFGSPPPATPLGSWTLLDAGTMLAAPYALGYNHFLVFRGVKGNRALLADPAWGNRTMTIEKFQRMWLNYGDPMGHVGFVVEPADGREPPSRMRPKPSEFVMLQ